VYKKEKGVEKGNLPVTLQPYPCISSNHLTSKQRTRLEEMRREFAPKEMQMRVQEL
jgi:hypothetical protein